MKPNSRMMIVSTVASTGRRMLSSEMFIRRGGYSTASSFTGRSVRSWSVPEVITVSPGSSPERICTEASVRRPVCTSTASARPLR